MWFTNSANNSIGRITTTGAVTNYTDSGIDGPDAIAAGPDGATVVHQLRQQFHRTDHHRRRLYPLWRRGTLFPGAKCITAGPDGALWFTDSYNDPIFRITTTGTMSISTNSTIADPDAITSGPDGAMWFTNNSDSSIGQTPPRGLLPTTPVPT